MERVSIGGHEIGRAVIVGFLLSLAVILLAINSKGQNNIVQWQVGGTWTKVRLLNTTSAPVIPSIGDRRSGSALSKDGIFEVKYGYGWQGNVAITADVCTGRLQAMPLVSLPPLWARKFIKENYPDLTVTELKKEAAAAERSLKDRPGEKMRRRELEGWFRMIKKYGAEATTIACSDSTPLVFTVDATQWGYTRTITVLVKSGPNGYYLQPQY